MTAHLIMALIGFGSGVVVAGGVIALIVGLGIAARYIGITHTGNHLWYYEDSILLGGLFGTFMTVYHVMIPVGMAGLAVLGLAAGIYVGGWIMALAEVVNIFPIFARRIGLVKGMSIIIIAVALGKTLGSMLAFYMRW